MSFGEFVHLRAGWIDVDLEAKWKRFLGQKSSIHAHNVLSDLG
jgi:hypothetical protein